MAMGRYVLRDPTTGQEKWTIHLECPKCSKNLSLVTDKKPFEVTDHGIITGEPIRCAWEGDFGEHTCNWAAELEPPKKTEGHQMVPDMQGIQPEIQIDAIMREV